MSAGVIVVLVALTLTFASFPLGLWWRRRPGYRSIPRPTPWMVADAQALAKRERAALNPTQRKAVDRAVSRGAAVDDPALALAAYRTARASSAEERDRLVRFPRGFIVPSYILLALFSPGLVRGEGLVFGESGLVDGAMVLLVGTTLMLEAVRPSRTLHLLEQAEELNSELIPVEVPEPLPRKRGRWSSRREQSGQESVDRPEDGSDSRTPQPA